MPRLLVIEDDPEPAAHGEPAAQSKGER